MCPGSERGPACMWNTSPPASTVKIFPGILLSGRLMTGSGMKGCHDPHSGPVRLPSRLVFYLGNYTGGAFSARWNGNAIIVEETRGEILTELHESFHPGRNTGRNSGRRLTIQGSGRGTRSIQIRTGVAGLPTGSWYLRQEPDLFPVLGKTGSQAGNRRS